LLELVPAVLAYWPTAHVVMVVQEAWLLLAE
jgi:hypothetical protein